MDPVTSGIIGILGGWVFWRRVFKPKLDEEVRQEQIARRKEIGKRTVFVPEDKFELITIGERKRRYHCGHNAARYYKINMWGEHTDVFDQNKICGECMLEDLRTVAIRCCICKLPIIPDEAVAMYPVSADWNDPHGRVINDKVLGCTRMGCCAEVGMVGGHWTTKGFVPLFSNGLSMAEEAQRTGKTVEELNAE